MKLATRHAESLCECISLYHLNLGVIAWYRIWSTTLSCWHTSCKELRQSRLCHGHHAKQFIAGGAHVQAWGHQAEATVAKDRPETTRCHLACRLLRTKRGITTVTHLVKGSVAAIKYLVGPVILKPQAGRAPIETYTNSGGGCSSRC